MWIFAKICGKALDETVTTVLLLAESQSTWTYNILPRMLEYLVKQYHDHIVATEQNIYGSKRINLPKAELYVIYTGNETVMKDTISLADEFLDGDDSF